jgi:toxin ParE1/3/4
VQAYRLARPAEADLKSIVGYTMKTWGETQTVRYNQDLKDSFLLLFQNPSIGRSCDSIQTGLRRFEMGKRVIIYRTMPYGIRIVRVLHQQMVPAELHFAQ